MDDFRYYASSRSEAEEVLAVWESALADYELQVNPLKTRVIEGPPAIQPRWRTQLSQFRIRTGSDLTVANDTHRVHGTRLRSVELLSDRLCARLHDQSCDGHTPTSKGGLEQSIEMALAAVVVHPSTLPFLSTALRRSHDLGVSIDGEVLSHALNELVHGRAPLQHGVEVSWALWILHVHGAPLGEAGANRVSAMADNTARTARARPRGCGTDRRTP